MRIRYTTCLLLWIALALPAWVSAQNVLVNGDFDIDFSNGWQANGSSGSASQDAAAGSPGLGSVLLHVNDPSGNSLSQAIEQCVTAVAGANYTLSGRALLGTLTGATGGDGMGILGQFFPNPGCTGAATSHIANSTGTASGQPSDFTVYSTVVLSAPVGTHSMKVTAQVQTGGAGAGTAEGWVDHIQLVTDDIFTDGFE